MLARARYFNFVKYIQDELLKKKFEKKRYLRFFFPSHLDLSIFVLKIDPEFSTSIKKTASSESPVFEHHLDD